MCPQFSIVMKKLLTVSTLLLLAPFLVLAYSSPGKPSGFLNDFAGILNSSEKQTLESKLASFRQETGAELAVVTVSSLSDETIEGYAVKLFEEWGIGQKDKDNGLLLLVAPNDREVRIEVGYGLEGTVTDLQSGNVINKVILPAFRSNNYFAGINGGVDALITIVRNDPGAEEYSAPSMASKFDVDPRGVIFLVFIVISILARVLSRTKSWWLGGVLGAVAGVIIGFIWGFLFAGVSAIVILSILGFIFDFIVSKGGPRGPHSGIFFGPGGFGGSGSSGGFGGFGGGFSGGGGASGRW